MARNFQFKLDPAKFGPVTIPSADFVNEQFDNNNTTPQSTSKLLIILSTPRSGSSYLSHLLHNTNYCIAHEYFQTWQYMQILGKRWQCVNKNMLDMNKYICELKRNRTSSNGVLGIKVHGSHIKTFQGFLPLLSNIQVNYVFLKRENQIAQAVSYEIASQTHKWSTKYESDQIPNYSFTAINKRLLSIQYQTALIQSFIKKNNLRTSNILYEDLCTNPRQSLLSMGLNENVEAGSKTTIAPQATNINAQWEADFANDLLKQNYQPSKGRFQKVLNALFSE